MKKKFLPVFFGLMAFALFYSTGPAFASERKDVVGNSGQAQEKVNPNSYYGVMFYSTLDDFNNTNAKNNLISDGAFIDINSMTVAEIQDFLSNKGSFLKNYSEGGRSAAQIIWDAAHGYGEASGSINGISITTNTGTVSPKVILVTLQKEQSLIAMTSQNDNSLRAAMGYACPDSGGCNSAYAGFTKQVENGAWQLRYNYERAQGKGFSDYQVGQSQNFSDVNGSNTVTFSNRATSALYRYTPHVFNGNYNFWRYNQTWFETPEYRGSYVTQSPWDAANNVNNILSPGESANFSITIKNTGSATWYRDGANPIHLAVLNDRHSVFLPNTSDFQSNRVAKMVESSVASGENGTFNFTVTAPARPGMYYEHYQFVAEFKAWFYPDVMFQIKVAEPRGEYVTQSPWDAANNVNTILSPGESANFSITVKNVGQGTWYRDGNYPVNLAVLNDRYSDFLPITPYFKNNRAARLNEASVAPGQTGTFTFTMTAPSTPGMYYEHYQLVMENSTWFFPDVMFQIKVAGPRGEYVIQSPWDAANNVNAVMSPGQSMPFSLTVKNVGQGTWYRDGAHPVNLAVLNDRTSQFLPVTAYFSNNRAARLNEASVAPGQTGTFTFTMTAPSTPGMYYEHYQLVMEGSAWFFPDVMFQIRVQ